MAQGAGRARDRAGPRGGAPAGGDRPARALRDPLPGQGDQGQAGAVARQAPGEDGEDRARPHGFPRAVVHVQGARAKRARGVRAQGRQDRGARPGAARRRGPARRARRARDAGGGQRQREDHPDRDAGRPARAAGREALHRTQRAPRLRVAALGGPERPGHGARRHPARHRPHPRQGTGAARRLPLLGRGGAEAGGGALRGRAQAPVARRARELGREHAGARRAHQPPRPREPRGARGRAAGLPRLAAAGVPRPRAARRGGHPHRRGRGGPAALLRGRLGRLPAGARSAPRGRGEARGGARDDREEEGQAQRPGPPTGTPRSPRSRRTRAAPRPRWSARSRRPRSPCAPLEEELADPSAWSDPERSAASTERHAQAKRHVEELYARLEAVAL